MHCAVIRSATYKTADSTVNNISLAYRKFLHPMGQRKLWETPTNGNCWLNSFSFAIALILGFVPRSFMKLLPGDHQVQEFLIHGAKAYQVNFWNKTQKFPLYWLRKCLFKMQLQQMCQAIESCVETPLCCLMVTLYSAHRSHLVHCIAWSD